MITSLRSPRSLPRSDNNHCENVGETLTRSDEKFYTKNLAITILAITTYYFYFEKGCVMKHRHIQLLKKSQYCSAAP